MEGSLSGRNIIALVASLAVFTFVEYPIQATETKNPINYKIVDDSSIPLSLTGNAGDPANGRKVAIHRKKGNCLACHVMPIEEQPFHGRVGPNLNGVAGRYTEGELRLLIVNAKKINEDTIMPAFYKNEGFNRIRKKFRGKTILSAQEVEDVVAYLMTME
tara:strand:- start:363 stop:842 length:480 start_codon:yes stop_codon:yes gene_type:complete